MRLAAIVLLLFASPMHVGWSVMPSLPSAVTNNAVASYVHKDHVYVYSLMGLGKDHNAAAVTTNSMVYDGRHEEWRFLTPVPGKQGRLGASAAVVDGDVYLLGGYTVDENGKQTTVAALDIYSPNPEEPTEGYWSKGVPIPVPVNDAVVGVLDDRYIVLVSGWSKDDTTANVQIYDTWHDHWRTGSVLPGKPVFGHAGTIVNNSIVYCGGAYVNPESRTDAKAPRFLTSDECWEGRITSTNPLKVDWKQLPPHPGSAQFGMTAGVWEHRAVFSGGTTAPHNYDGTGADGKPAVPASFTFAWNLDTHSWETLPENPEPTMGLPQMAPDKQGLVLVGGMQAGQKVGKRVAHLALSR